MIYLFLFSSLCVLLFSVASPLLRREGFLGGSFPYFSRLLHGLLYCFNSQLHPERSLRNNAESESNAQLFRPEGTLVMFRPIFHLAFPVRDLEEAKKFYVTTFDARVGRVREKWLDIFLFEGQITLHERPSEVLSLGKHGVRHFGAILAWHDWEALANRLDEMRVKFKVKPNVSFVDTDAEQAKMVLFDPSGNVIEVKAYRNLSVALEMEDDNF